MGRPEPTSRPAPLARPGRLLIALSIGFAASVCLAEKPEAPPLAALGEAPTSALGGAATGTPDGSAIDRILVDKSDRALYLVAGGEIVRRMDIALGLVPEGHKQQEGDFRTPEGLYFIEAKNPDSDYFLSLKISYPNAADRRRARRLGVDPGGQIMIHGLPNRPKYTESRYEGADWTDGCIAVSNADMIDLWQLTAVSTPIEIRP